MIVRIIGDLKRVIADLPDEMPIKGYDGETRIPPVSVYVNDYKEVDAATRPPPTLIIDVD